MFKPAFDKQRQYYLTGQTKPLKHRLQMLDRLKQMVISAEPELLATLNKDLHKNRQEAYLSELLPVFLEINHARKNLKKWMRQAGKGSSILTPGTSYKVYPEPRGQVLIISPWNYPVNLSLLPLASALAAGNTAIVKVSEFSRSTSKTMVEQINKTFNPRQVYATGVSPDEFKDLFDLPYDHIFFTGSSRVGRLVMQQAGRHLTPVTLELGGKSPAIIHKTAKIELAARRIAWGKWINAGQTCIAPDYVLVEKCIKEDFLNAFFETTRQMYPEPLTGDGFARIINDKNFNRLQALLEGQEVLFGGNSSSDDLKLEPTVVNEPSLESPLMQDEIFGPIIPVLTYETTADIYKVISHNPEPLALYIFSQQDSFIRELTRNISFGGGAINDTLVQFLSQKVPFGGRGESGMGCYHGKHGFDTFSHFKTIAKTPSMFDLSFRYPPYKERVIKAVKRLVE